jgi:GT2 family glycosyltransferase
MLIGAILMTVYNRKNKTLRCLDSLFHAINGDEDYSVEIYLTDDGSTDGTSEAIKERFPSVNILFGNGNLYWCRGMISAWEFASKAKDYDFYIWLNDDTFLFNHSISTLINSSVSKNHSAIIGGAFRSEFKNEPTYGGIANNRFVVPNGNLQEIDLLNGNLVLVPKIVYEKIGMLDYSYHHGLGDHDYGLLAKKAGFKLFLTPIYIGYCERHDNKCPKCYDKSFSLIERFRFLYSPNGPNPLVNSLFFLRHRSMFETIDFFLTSNIVTAFPNLLGIKNRLKKIFYNCLDKY